MGAMAVTRTSATTSFSKQTEVHNLRTQDPLKKALVDAIERDDAEAIESLVRKGAPLYRHYYHSPQGPVKNELLVKDFDLVNPVDWAALSVRLRAAAQLLELGDGRRSARPRQKESADISMAQETHVALAIAAAYGHLGLMRMLLERGAFVGQTDRQGKSALRLATQKGCSEAVALLLQYGAWDVESERNVVMKLAAEHRPSSGLRTSMASVFEAAGLCLNEAEDLDKTLSVGNLSFGASSGASYKRSLASAGRTLASASPRTTLAMAVASGGRCRDPPKSQPSTPSPAARREAWLREGHTTAVAQTSLLGRDRPQPNDAISWGWSPLASSAASPIAAASGGGVYNSMPGTPSIELNSGEAQLRGELRRAVRKGDSHAVRALVGRGAPLEAAIDLGFGPAGNWVDWACVCEQPNMAIELMALADEQSLGDELAMGAHTGFFWAVSQGQVEVLRELLRRGADPGQLPGAAFPSQGRGEACWSALAMAVFGLRKEEILELIRYGAWDREAEPRRQQLLAWARNRRLAAEAFQEAGICQFEGVIWDVPRAR